MKKFFKISIWAIAALGLSALFYACSQDDLTEATSTVANEDFTVRVTNGYLEFKDQATFDEIKESLKDADRETMDAWEGQFSGFTSLRNVYDQANKEQDMWFDQVQNMDSIDVVALMQHNDDFWYSEYIIANSHSFILLDSGDFELNIPIIEFDDRKYVNSLGLLKIGESLFTYQKDNIYIILDGDERKLNRLSSLEQSSVEEDIVKIEFEEREIMLGDNARFTGNASCEGFTSGMNQRVLGSVIVGSRVRLDLTGSLGFPGRNAYQPYCDLSAKNEIDRGWPFGWSGKLTSELRIEVDDLDIFLVNIVDIQDDNFTVTSGGDNVKSLYIPYWQSSQWFSGAQEPRVEGDITFVGRNSSTCTL